MSGQLSDGTFAPGNQLAKRVKFVHGAIQRAVIQDDGAKLRKMVDAMLDLACDGDVQAATWVRDSLDGKPAQAVTVSGDEDRPLITAIKMIVVQAANHNEINNLVAIQGSDETKKIIDATESREIEATPPTPAQANSPKGMGG